jgi:hypothetical protein
MVQPWEWMIMVSLQTPGENKKTLISRGKRSIRGVEKIKNSKEERENTKSDESPGPQFSYQSKP